MQNLVLVGIALLFIAIILIIIGSLSSSKTESRWVVGIFPFYVGSDPKMVWIAFIISIVLIALFLFIITKGIS